MRSNLSGHEYKLGTHKENATAVREAFVSASKACKKPKED